MPTCRCGKRIQSGRLCQDCERDERLGGFSPASTRSDPDEQRYECSNCGHTYTDDGWNGCPKCDSSRRRYVGDVDAGDDDDDPPGAAVALPDGGKVAGRDVVENLVDQIRDTWTSSDPLVLAFEDDESNPIVADVDGELRVLSSALVYPREVDHEDVREALDRHGRPAVDHLSDHSDRFDREAFEDGQELATDGGQSPTETVELQIRTDRANLAGVISVFGMGVGYAEQNGMLFGPGQQILNTVLGGMEDVYPQRQRVEDLGEWIAGEQQRLAPEVDVELVELEDDLATDVDDSDDDDPDDRDGVEIPIADGGEPTPLDARLREELEHVLVVGAGRNTDRRLHIPQDDAETPLCDHAQGRSTNYQHKDVAVSPPGYLTWCDQCALAHLGSPEDTNTPTLDVIPAEIPDGYALGVTQTGESTHIVDYDADSVLTDRPDVGDDRSLCGHIGYFEHVEADEVTDPLCTDCCNTARSRHGVDPRADSDHPLRADGDGREAFLRGDAHYCDICSRPFDSTDELANHDCQPVRTDGGAAVGPPLPVVKRGSIGVTVLGPDPDQYERWEQSRSDGGEPDA